MTTKELIDYLRAHPPPGGAPVLGRDFTVGPQGSAVGERMPGFCGCNCGLKAEPRHPGLAPLGG